MFLLIFLLNVLVSRYAYHFCCICVWCALEDFGQLQNTLGNIASTESVPCAPFSWCFQWKVMARINVCIDIGIDWEYGSIEN